MKELSEWIVIDGYCGTRVLKGSDHNVVDNRIAFIEKTPRIFNGTEWIYGPKGSGGAYTEDHEKLGQYGFDPESREWCDIELKKLGYHF